MTRKVSRSKVEAHIFNCLLKGPKSESFLKRGQDIEVFNAALNMLEESRTIEKTEAGDWMLTPDTIFLHTMIYGKR